MNRRNNRKNPNDIFGVGELMDAWMEMMQSAEMLNNEVSKYTPLTKRFDMAKPKHEGTMSYEDREKNTVFKSLLKMVESENITIVVNSNQQ